MWNSGYSKGAAPKQYMIRQAYDSSSSTMGDILTQHSDKQRKRNPHRSQRGIFPECLKVYMCKLVHICVTIYLSSWTSITTSHWIIQNYKIKEHPHACWRINGFINDEWEDDEPKRSSILQATLIHFHMWHCVHTHVFACTLRKCKHSHKGIL